MKDALEALKNNNQEVVKEIPPSYFKNVSFIIKACSLRPECYELIDRETLNIDLIRLIAFNSIEAKKYIENKIDTLLEDIDMVLDFEVLGYINEGDLISKEVMNKYLNLFKIEMSHLWGNVLTETNYFYRGIINILKKFFNLKNAPKLDDKKLIDDLILSTRISPLEFAIDNLRNDSELVQEAIMFTNGKAIDGLDSFYQEDRSYILGWLAFYPEAYAFLNVTLRNDIEVLCVASKMSGHSSILYSSNELRNSKEDMIKLVKYSPSSYFYMEKEMQEDKDIVIAAIEEDPFIYNRLDDYLRDNSQIKSYYDERMAKYPGRYKELVDPVPKPYFSK